MVLSTVLVVDWYMVPPGRLAWDVTPIPCSGVVLGNQGSNAHIYDF